MSFVVKADECFIPMGEAIDVEAEKATIQKELDYTKGFLAGVEKKLSNERFVAGAPARRPGRVQRAVSAPPAPRPQ
jgi:valyl-tRNA synthetase